MSYYSLQKNEFQSDDKFFWVITKKKTRELPNTTLLLNKKAVPHGHTTY